MKRLSVSIVSVLAVWTAQANADCGSASMHLRGTFNNWSSQAMVCEDGVFKANAYFTGGTARFKFDRFANWSENYGDNNVDGAVEQNGSDIYTQNGDGYYGIEFDYANRRSRFAKCEGVRLSHSPAGGLPEQMQAFTCDASGAWRSVINVSAGQGWEITNANLPEMFTRYGDNEGDGVLDAQGAPLSFPGAGQYALSVDSVNYTYAIEALDCGPAFRYERPSLTGHLQTHSMSCSLPARRWEATIAPWSSTSPYVSFHVLSPSNAILGDFATNGFAGTLVASEGFQFFDGRTLTLSVDPVSLNYQLRYQDCGPAMRYERPSITGKLQTHAMSCDSVTGEWTAVIEPWSPTSPLLQFHLLDPVNQTWGDSDSNGSAGSLVAGEGFLFSNGQRLVLRVDMASQSYSISSDFESQLPSLNFRGTPNNWGATAMQLVADNLWETTATFSGSNTRFKFDVYADWSENYGDNNADGIADGNGADIPVANGTYVIRFNDATLQYQVIAQ